MALFSLGLSLGTIHGVKAAEASSTTSAGFPPEAVEFFETRVRPVLAESCLRCHGEKKQSSELRLDWVDSRKVAVALGSR
jgi:methylphosphotriester-DNA--protein-cysteine methyltransferase